jgi:hypothetical protein
MQIISLAVLLPLSALLAVSGHAEVNTSTPFERTEEREPCTDYNATRQPLFGDLHVHTSYSFDSYLSSQRRDPWDAYRYAKGEAIILPDANGDQTVRARIGRPVMTRGQNIWVQLLAANWWTDLGGQLEADPDKSFACSLSDCDAGDAEAWRNIQQAAEDNYDRSAECSFTSFVGYEYTEAFDQNNMHRNVIFRNSTVTDAPISIYDTGRQGSFPSLWRQLRENCTDLDNGCDVMSIPHNSNLSGGRMFRDPKTTEELENRLFFEPVVELVQHKGASECRYDRLRGMGLDTVDEQCDFEQIAADNHGLHRQHGYPQRRSRQCGGR